MGASGDLAGGFWIAAVGKLGLTGIGGEFSAIEDGIGVGAVVVFGGCAMGKAKGGLTMGLGVVFGRFWTGFGVDFVALGLSISCVLTGLGVKVFGSVGKGMTIGLVLIGRLTFAV
jgi:hypothetical protein